MFRVLLSLPTMILLKRSYLSFLLLIISTSSFAFEDEPIIDSSLIEKSCKIEYKISDIYCGLKDTSLDFSIFEKAYTGYLNLVSLNKIEKKDILTIIDFGQSSLQERMYIIDLNTNEIIHKSLVSHGIYSGRTIPQKFSNEVGSGKSSLGFYTVNHTYKGKFDLAVKLNGLEYSNSHAHKRGIVMHAAKYANPEFAKKNGSLGRSLGCPALPQEGFKEVVDIVKGGSCLFIYAPNRSYQRRSKLLNRTYFLK
jgi:hypothetical protein